MGIGDKPKFDIYIIVTYLLLTIIGWVSIYSAAPVKEYTSIFDFNELYGKQLIWMCLAFFMAVIILSIEVKFYERFSSVLYVVSLLSLLGLFLFGKEINGATSWYSLGNMTLQPSEFAKAATALAVAKYLSGINISLKNIKDLLWVCVIIGLPALLIIPQPDPGSALVYGAFFFALYREGLSFRFLGFGLIAIFIFLGTIAFNMYWVCMLVVIVGFLWFKLSQKRNHKKRKPKPELKVYIVATLVAVMGCVATPYVFNHVLKDRHRNRINLVLGKIEDQQGVAYNLNQSQIAIGSGGWTGKGLRQGTQTQGGFVPEQETDFIFSAIGEEWGFLGSTIVVILFMFLISRLVIMAERQRNQFARIYGYSVAGIFFIHFFVNIGMVIGLLPTVGIPLPFMSYGGSGLWGFTILLFVFLKLDAHRMSYEH